MSNFTESMVTMWHQFLIPDGEIELKLDRFIVRWDTFWRMWNIRKEILREDGMIHAEAYDPENTQRMVSLVIDPLSALVVEYHYTVREHSRTFHLLHGEYREKKEEMLVAP